MGLKDDILQIQKDVKVIRDYLFHIMADPFEATAEIKDDREHLRDEIVYLENEREAQGEYALALEKELSEIKKENDCLGSTIIAMIGKNR